MGRRAESPEPSRIKVPPEDSQSAQVRGWGEVIPLGHAFCPPKGRRIASFSLSRLFEGTHHRMANLGNFNGMCV